MSANLDAHTNCSPTRFQSPRIASASRLGPAVRLSYRGKETVRPLSDRTLPAPDIKERRKIALRAVLL